MNAVARTASSPALRLARRAWQLQFEDSDQSLALADQALARVTADGKGSETLPAHAWGHLARGYHRMRHSTTAQACVELEHAQRCFDLLADRRGLILVAVGLSRCAWMEGQLQESLDLIMPLRDEGLHVLKQEERGMLLNGIAGCYSTQGEPAQAFAYMYQALRESSPAHNNGFDVVLFCNLAHELYQLGDCEAALSYVQEGLARCEQLRNERLKNVLHSNRILCLLELERHQEALVAARALMEHNCQGDGPGTQGVAFEAVALAAAHGGDAPLGDTALTRAAYTQPQDPLPEVQVDLAVAQALLLAQHRYAEQAVQRLEQELPITNISVSLRAQCLLHDTLAHLHGQLRHNAKALEHLQHWRTLHMARTRLASQARYQAASLHTELLRVQRQRDDIDARRAATERARTELLQANRQLQEKMQEVQTLKDELQQQALRDSLTGLYNRRHLNETLPTLFAIARREAQPLAVVVIDLDHFKQVNDVHGHLAGDEVLQAFARLLQTHLRKSDVACRYGGEEFCLLMPATTVQAAAGKLAELLAMWRAHSFHVESGRLDALSFSAGIADSTLDTVHSMHVLKCADDYTLHAKRLGRNRICGVGLGEDFLCAPTQANVVQLGAHRHSGK